MSKRIKAGDVTPRNLPDTLLREAERNTHIAQELAQKAAAAARIDAAKRINVMKIDFDNALAKDRATTNARLEAIDRVHTENLRRQTKSIDGLQKQINTEIRDVNKRINNIVTDINEHLVEIGQNLDEHGRLIENVNNRLSDQQEQLNRIYQSMENEEERASIIIEDLSTLLKAIDKRCPHQKYDERGWMQIMRDINTVVLSGDSASVRLAGARRLISRLMDFEENVWAEQLRFVAIYNIALSEVDKVLSIMATNRMVSAKIDDQTSMIEVDFWTRGDYARLLNEMEQLKIELIEHENAPELTRERVIEITTRITEIEAEQRNLVLKAVEEGICSQVRADMCEDITNALERQGFDLIVKQDGEEAIGYIGGNIDCDEREATYAMLRERKTGMEITIKIDKTECSNAQQISFHRNSDEEMSEGAYMNKLKEISRMIGESGYEMPETMKTPVGYGDGNQKATELADPIALERAKYKVNAI